MLSSHIRCPLLVLFLASWFSVPLAAQQEHVNSGRGHVPAIAVVSIRLHVPTILQAPAMEMLPVEVADAWLQENFRFKLDSLEQIQVVLGVPAGPGPPPLGAVVSWREDFDPTGINPDLFPWSDQTRSGGRRVFFFEEGPEPLLLHMTDPRTAILANAAMFDAMLEAPEGEGPLADLIESNPMGEAAVEMIAAIEPARPILVGMTQQFGGQLPPPLQGLTEAPEVVDALVVHATIRRQTQLQIAIEVAGVAEAQRLEKAVGDAIAFARQMALMQVQNDIRGEGAVVQAQRAYARRMSDLFTEMLTPTRVENRLIVDATLDGSVATTGVLIGLLLPAVQAAREAARRTSAANNLRQIGIALHNYHDVHNKWPENIVDDDGQPLLSWRVQILPYLDQRALYEQIHLDEPWDSAHNLQLAKRVLPVFTDPSVVTLPGQTVFQACVGEELIFHPDGGNSIRDITDGTSNTIMVVETDAREAVPWMSPQDVTIDLDDPRPVMGHVHPGGFQTLFGDGSVRFISDGVDKAMLRALLTRSGGEIVGGF